jgi:hypothetical protein
MIVKLVIITKINRNARKKRKNIDVMFIMVKSIQKMLLKTQIGNIVMIVLDLSSIWKV